MKTTLYVVYAVHEKIQIVTEKNKLKQCPWSGDNIIKMSFLPKFIYIYI